MLQPEWAALGARSTSPHRPFWLGDRADLVSLSFNFPTYSLTKGRRFGAHHIVEYFQLGCEPLCLCLSSGTSVPGLAQKLTRQEGTPKSLFDSHPLQILSSEALPFALPGSRCHGPLTFARAFSATVTRPPSPITLPKNFR